MASSRYLRFDTVAGLYVKRSQVIELLRRRQKLLVSQDGFCRFSTLCFSVMKYVSVACDSPRDSDSSFALGLEKKENSRLDDS